MNKKKILFVITKSNWGGAQRYVFDLATSIPKDKFDVVVAFGGTGKAGAEAGKLEQKLKEKEIPTVFIKSFMRDISIFKEFAAFFELLKIFKKENPDVVHLNSSKAGGVGALAARLAGVKKIIFTSHGLVWDEDRNVFAKIAIWLLSWLTFLLCHNVIVISKDNERRAGRLPFCKSKIVLIYNGILSIDFLEKEEARAALAARAGGNLSSSGICIGVIAELTRNKGLPYLVDAVKILVNQGQDMSVIVIGEGEERQPLEEMIREKKLRHHIYLLGFVPDAYRYIGAFDIFVLPSIKEGIPYVILEAGLASLPVVASKIPGIVDAIDHGSSGLLFESKNPEDLAKKLSVLIDDSALRRSLGDKLRAEVSTRFSISQMSLATQKLYLDN